MGRGPCLSGSFSGISLAAPSRCRFRNNNNSLISNFMCNVLQVAASFASEGSVMNELKQWNDLYGEGGSRKKQQLTYFL